MYNTIGVAFNARKLIIKSQLPLKVKSSSVGKYVWSFCASNKLYNITLKL